MITRFFRGMDWYLLILTLVICCLGVLQIFSATEGTKWQDAWWKQVVFVGGGLLLGTAAALIAVWPAIVDRGQTLPFASLAAMLAAVALTALVASTAAVRLATSMSVTQAVKNE